MAGTLPVVNDIVLFPHCDLHLALNGAPQLALRVMRRISDPESPMRYVMEPVEFTDMVFSFLAPYEATGHRLDHLPTVRQGENSSTAVVTATVLGVYLFEVRVGDQYMVGRLQVHNSIAAWWFGNNSITTAKDGIGHAQPTIYAAFSDDQADRAAGTDLVGDITGHGYVTLTSSDESVFTVTPEGRLLGLRDTDAVTDPQRLPRLRGILPAQPSANIPPADIPVRVVNYTKTRADLTAVDAPAYVQAKDKHNILFLPEGFRAQDKDLFDKIVAHVKEEMFTKPRHQPFGLLKDSFNVFKYFVPSQDQALTCAFRVVDTTGDVPVEGRPFLPKGAAFPIEDQVDDSPYTVAKLVTFVGLPKRGENRSPSALRQLWSDQNLLPEFRPDQAGDKLIRVWLQRSVGLLQTRDTFFGLQIGRRFADRASSTSVQHVDRPAQDIPNMAMSLFVQRLYEFYNSQDVASRGILLDPRRHPPELYAYPDEKVLTEPTNPNNSVARFFGGLQYTVGTRTFPIGQEWAPKDSEFQRSRGLVAVIALEDFHSGRAINNFSMTAQATSGKTLLSVEYDDPQAKRVFRRKIDKVAVDMDDVVNKATHEFGHALNLGDENESFPNASKKDPQGTIDKDPVAFDNVMILGTIRPRPPAIAPAADTDAIDPDRVKWINLPRMLLSSRLVARSQAANGNLKIAIDPKEVGQWVQALAKNQQLQVSLRAFGLDGMPNRQLPLGQLLEGLSIVGTPDESAGLITLTGAAIPTPVPVLDPGSVLYVPLRNNTGVPLVATDRHVLAHLRSTKLPLNRNKNKSKPSNDPEDPEDIDGFRPPCKKKYRVVGVYEGALQFAGGRYRPAGSCKMRNHATETPDSGAATIVNPISTFRGRNETVNKDSGAEYCFVCKWLIVNRVNPSMHRILTAKYYPTAKTSEDD